MKNLRITGVPEHFNFPLISALQEIDSNIQPLWSYSPGGTGEMIEKLMNQEVDAAVLLSEGFFKSQEYLKPVFVDFYISSPLVWGIHNRYESNLNEIAKPNKIDALISRPHSGSHLMLHVLANREEWKTLPKTKIIGNLQGAIDYNATLPPEYIFLWEQFTTAPYCKPGGFKCIDSIPTPWPAFCIALRPDILNDFSRKNLQEFFAELKHSVLNRVFGDVITEDIAHFSGLDERNVMDWREQTEWYGIDDVQEALKSCDSEMLKYGVIQKSQLKSLTTLL